MKKSIKKALFEIEYEIINKYEIFFANRWKNI